MPASGDRRQCYFVIAIAPDLRVAELGRRSSICRDERSGTAQILKTLRNDPKIFPKARMMGHGALSASHSVHLCSTPAAAALFEHGLPVAIGGKALALLRALVEARGQVVAKSALMDAAWPNTSVEESNLTVQIAALRRRLRVSPDGEDWIATFPRVGYRFAGPLTVEECEAPTIHARLRRSGRSRRSPSCPLRI